MYTAAANKRSISYNIKKYQQRQKKRIEGYNLRKMKTIEHQHSLRANM